MDAIVGGSDDEQRENLTGALAGVLKAIRSTADAAPLARPLHDNITLLLARPQRPVVAAFHHATQRAVDTRLTAAQALLDRLDDLLVTDADGSTINLLATRGVMRWDIQRHLAALRRWTAPGIIEPPPNQGRPGDVLEQHIARQALLALHRGARRRLAGWRTIDLQWLLRDLFDIYKIAANPEHHAREARAWFVANPTADPDPAEER